MISLLFGIATAGQSYAELTPLKTKDSSASSYEHKDFTECSGGMYFTVSSVSSADDSTNGLYNFDHDNAKTTHLVKSTGNIRGLVCQHKHLYYFRRATDGSDGKSWGLYRYNSQKAGSDDAEEFLHDASKLKHEPLVNYEGDLFLAGSGPKLYKLILTTDVPTLGLVWTGPSPENGNTYPESMIVHKNERDSDLYFVAPAEDGHAWLWKFNIQNDQATKLKDLVLRTGDSEPTIANMISYKGPQDFASILFFSLGGFEKSEGHHRLAKWQDDGNLPVVTEVKGYDPTLLTIYKDHLFMVLRKPTDVSQYGVWEWNGRFIKQVFALPNMGKISQMTVWDDILVVSGDSGPLVVFNGKNIATVEVSAKLTDVSDMIAYKGELLLAATEDPADQGNGLWSLTKGVWTDPNAVGDDEEDSGNNKPSNNKPSNSKPSSGTPTADEQVTEDDNKDASGNTPPAWSMEVSGSSDGGGGGGVKAIIILFVLAFVGALCWWAYKSGNGIEQKGYGDGGSKDTWTGDERSGDEFEADEGVLI